jgi:predicted lipoprotein with Yx(FWY)xxD motif
MDRSKLTNRVPKVTVKFRPARVVATLLVAFGLTGAAAGTAGASTSLVVSTRKTTQFGTILVSGKTVYTLKPSNVVCGAQCLKIWPPVLLPKGVKRPRASAGVNAARLGVVKGAGGALQVTYSGKRLYYFVKDSARGQVNGNVTDKWGKWSVVVTAKPAHPSSQSGGSPTTNAGSGGVSF